MTVVAQRLACRVRRGWPLERALFAIAGSVTLSGVLLGALASPWFFLLPGFVGLNQLVYVALGDCPMSLLLRRAGVTEGAGG